MILGILILTLVATGGIMFCNRPGAFCASDGRDFELYRPGEHLADDGDDEPYVEIDDADDGGVFRPPSRTNFLLVGLDLNLLADAIMVGTFYRDTGDIHLMSIPRDHVVQIPQHRLDYMRERGMRPPHTLKLTELRAHGGQVEGIYIFKAQLEEMLGVEFDYYVEIRLAAFRRTVDAIGGVEMYIPRRLFYQDPTANPPTNINVPAGLQRLDGHMAEGVVRYRRWPMGDIQRNEMQMEFMTQLIRQAATRDAIFNDPMELVRIVIEETNTNFGVIPALTYLPYISNVDTESVETFSMPGRIGVTIGNRTEFFVPDSEQLPGILNQVFYADTLNVATPEESEEPVE